jgi:hypothetical protein
MVIGCIERGKGIAGIQGKCLPGNPENAVVATFRSI